MTTSLELKNACKNFGDAEIIKNVSFKIEKGEFIVFVGPSGCGKSTLLRMIAGLEDISSGELLMDGKVMNEVPPVHRDVAMVFQSYALYPHMNTYENMAFGLRNLKIPEEEIKRRVDKASGILQIQRLMNSKPKDMSGGQRQRVAIGRTIVREPKMFLFDEPLSNLDAALRVQMRIEMAKLHKQLATTMIYVTHDQVEAMTLADSIVVLNAGRVEQIGRPLDLYENPCNLFVAGFIGSPAMNFIECEVAKVSAKEVQVQTKKSKQKLTVAIGSLGGKISRGDSITIGVRPEAVGLSKDSNNAISLDGNLVALEELGNTAYGYVEIAPGAIVTCLANNLKGSKEKVSVYFQAADCYIFDRNGKNISKQISK